MIDEKKQILSDANYEKVVAEMASFVSKAVSAPLTKNDSDRMSSEETYTASLLDLCKLIAVFLEWCQTSHHEEQFSLTLNIFFCLLSQCFKLMNRIVCADDVLVWGFNSPFLWRIKEEEIHSLYKSNIRQNHCEIAVGTGLFLSQVVSKICKMMTLIDLNENSLKSCEERIQHCCFEKKKGDEDYIINAVHVPKISKIVADITTPPGEDSALKSLNGTFQSVGANFLFHCLHGANLRDKMHAFQKCAALLDPEEGLFFGSTILGKEIVKDKERVGTNTMKVLNDFNDWGVFGILGDSYGDLKYILQELFEDVDLRRVGYCGVWRASRQK